MSKQGIFDGLSYDWKWASWDRVGYAEVHNTKPEIVNGIITCNGIPGLNHTPRADWDLPVPPEGLEPEIIERDIPKLREYIEATNGLGIPLSQLKAPVAPQLPPVAQNPWTIAESVDSPTHYAINYRLVGSRVTCQPPPLDTDQDVLMLVEPHNFSHAVSSLIELGYVREGSLPADEDCPIGELEVFASMCKGDMNFIVTKDSTFYKRFSAATELARHLNLMLKDERIKLFQAVLYGNWK